MLLLVVCFVLHVCLRKRLCGLYMTHMNYCKSDKNVSTVEAQASRILYYIKCNRKKSAKLSCRGNRDWVDVKVSGCQACSQQLQVPVLIYGDSRLGNLKNHPESHMCKFSLVWEKATNLNHKFARLLTRCRTGMWPSLVGLPAATQDPWPRSCAGVCGPRGEHRNCQGALS